MPSLSSSSFSPSVHFPPPVAHPPPPSASSSSSKGGKKGPDHRDPSGYVESPPACVVKVHGTARDDINGLMGIVLSYNLDRERYLVHMTKSQSTMAFKGENLMRGTWTENYSANYQQLRNDPRVRHKMTHYRTLCRSAVAPVKLSHAIVATVITVGLLFVLSGIIKTIMAMSLIVLIIIIAHHDLLEKKPLKVVVSNFPNRARISLEQHMPLLQGKLSNRMAAGIMLVIVTLVIQSLFFPFNSSNVTIDWPSLWSGSKQEEQQQQHPAHSIIDMEQNESINFHPPMDSTTTTTTTTISSMVAVPLDYDAIQEFYELGFHDGKEGNEHGTLLPSREEFILSWSSSPTTVVSTTSLPDNNMMTTTMMKMNSNSGHTQTCNETESSSSGVECENQDERGSDDRGSEEGGGGVHQGTEPSLDSKTGDTHHTGGKKQKANTLSSRSKAVSITNAASLFYLYKSFQELGTCPHTQLWGFAQLAANLHQSVPLWRKVLLGLSVYNVVRIVL